MIKSLLIANRGDVACRIIKTAKQMGIKTIAVYSSCDSNALHVKAADEAYWIGDSEASSSYLNVDSILNVAKIATVDGIHPGYGFLSESGSFAQKCIESGFLFIGPNPEIISLMGDKKAAKQEAEHLGLPILKDYRGAIPADSAERKRLVESIGLPVLIKAAAGGGGKGMRLVTHLNELDQAIESASREAKKAFSNDSLMIERYLPNARHIEVQIAGDSHGNVIHLFERECSVQRRHQKLIEEAPSSCTKSLKDTLFSNSIHLTKSLGYHTLGTVEFLVDDNDNHYFIEMNTRLQVEHPITEMITGIDCVALQIRLACNEPMPYSQENVIQSGHAFELRLCAEDPLSSFLPSTGSLVHWSFSKNTPGLRVDTGCVSGDAITPYYDSMFAKWIVYRSNRKEALIALQESLNTLCLRGITTNRNYLACLIEDDDFQRGQYTTQLLPNTLDRCLNRLSYIPKEAQLLLTAAHTLSLNACDPWSQADTWRLHGSVTTNQSWLINGIKCPISFQGSLLTGMEATIQESRYFFKARYEISNTICLDINEKTVKARVFRFGSELIITYQGRQYSLDLSLQHHALETDSKQNELCSPMPGTVISVNVKPGDKVKTGDTLLVIEAMKMEHAIKAPRDTSIKKILNSAGEQVKEGRVLIELIELN